MTLTEEQLAEIEARANAATPETWVGSWSTDGLGHYLVETARSRIVVAITTREEQGGENADFIAHARTDVPLLVAEVRRLAALKAAGVPALLRRLDAAEAVCELEWRERGLMTNARGATSLLGHALDAWRALRDKAPS